MFNEKIPNSHNQSNYKLFGDSICIIRDSLFCSDWSLRFNMTGETYRWFSAQILYVHFSVFEKKTGLNMQWCIRFRDIQWTTILFLTILWNRYKRGFYTAYRNSEELFVAYKKWTYNICAISHRYVHKYFIFSIWFQHFISLSIISIRVLNYILHMKFWNFLIDYTFQVSSKIGPACFMFHDPIFS